MSVKRMSPGPRRLARAALAAVLLGLPSLGLPARAGTLERVGSEAPALEESVLPGFRPGLWRSRVQLVWDGTARRLERRPYEMFDPLGDPALDLLWLADEPGGEAGGRISGEGRLLWRRAGAAAFDADAAVAEYRGTVADGRPEGFGTFVHRSGAAYRGAWAGGLMEGQGRLQLPNGDEYVGAFRAGRREGEGLYIDRTGASYRGGFRGGVRDGEGTVALVGGGAAFHALWRGGAEVAGTRRPAAGAVPVPVGAYESEGDLRLGVSVERRPIDGLPEERPLHYVAESTPEGLDVFPDDARLLAVWRGTAPIEARPEELYDTSYSGRSFLGLAIRYQPVTMRLDLENLGRDGAEVVGGYIEVERSRSELEPAVQAMTEEPPICGAMTSDTTFRLENYGWSRPENASISLGFETATGEAAGTRFEERIGTLDAVTTIDVAEALRQGGVDVGRLQEAPLACTDPQDCLAEARASGVFGQLADAVVQRECRFLARLDGRLAYDWRDADGAVHEKSSPFDLEILVGSTPFVAEGGEGGDVDVLSRDPFEFQLDRAAYRIPLPFDDDVPAGGTERWRLRLDAPKSSSHRFRVVLQLADGREIATRRVDLLYFKPAPLPATASLADDAGGDGADEDGADGTDAGSP